MFNSKTKNINHVLKLMSLFPLILYVTSLISVIPDNHLFQTMNFLGIYREYFITLDNLVISKAS